MSTFYSFRSSDRSAGVRPAEEAALKPGLTNPEKTSDEEQLLRDNDELYIYAGEVDTWEIPWGSK